MSVHSFLRKLTPNPLIFCITYYFLEEIKQKCLKLSLSEKATGNNETMSWFWFQSAEF